MTRALRAARAPAARWRRTRPAQPREPLPAPGAEPRSRVCYAAAHVVADPLAGGDPTGPAASTGTRRSPSAATCGRTGCASPRRWTPPSAAWAWTGPRRGADPPLGGRGAGASAGGSRAASAPTSSPPGRPRWTTVRAAYEEQLAFVEDAGAPVILMASRRAGRGARGARGLRAVYGRAARSVRAAGDPALAGRRCSTRRWRLLGLDRPRRRRRDMVARRSSPPTPPRSTASRSRCWTPSARSRCAAGCRRACASTPATTSTTPS